MPREPITIGDRTFSYLTHVKHTEFAPDGTIENLYCKMCGAVIAGQVERVVSSTVKQRDGAAVVVERVRTGFQRYANFCEAEIYFEDGGNPHQTTGCQKCLDPSLKPKHLMELYQADIIDLNEADPDGSYPPIPDFYKDRVPVSLAKLSRYEK